MKYIENDITKAREVRDWFSETLLEPRYEELLNKKTPQDEKESAICTLKASYVSIGEFEDNQVRKAYKKGKNDGILDGILIGELAMLGSYTIGLIIRYFLNKRA